MTAIDINRKPHPKFSATDVAGQKEQVVKGLQRLMTGSNPPAMYRRGAALYVPSESGYGVQKATRHDVETLITANFEMVDIAVATRRSPNPPTKHAKINPATVALFLKNCPQFIPEIERLIHAPQFVLINAAADDELESGEKSVTFKKMHLVGTPGYDAAAKTLYEPRHGLGAIDFNKNQFVSARAAYDYLRQEWLADCHVGPDNEAALLAAILTPAIKEVVGIAPGFLFWAESMSAGKTFWATVIATAYSGQDAKVLHWKDGFEMEWAISAALEREPPVVVIDNVKNVVKSALLDALMTSKRLQLRSVGQGAQDYPNKSSWLITANNPQLDNDAVRRFVPIQILPHGVIGRNFVHPNMDEYILNNRHRLLGAIYQIIRAGEAWVDADDAPDTSWDKFLEWSDKMGRICRMLGIPALEGNGAASVATSLEDEQVILLLETMNKIKTDGWKIDEIQQLITNVRGMDLEAFNQLPFMDEINRDGQKIVVLLPRAFGNWVREFGPTDHGGLKILRYRSHGQTCYKVRAT
jgi:hypothetical protein